MNRQFVRHLVQKGSKRGRALAHVLENPEWILSTTLLGTNLCMITINAVATLYVVEAVGEEYKFWTILLTAPLILFLGEALPKAFFQRHSDQLAMHLVFPLRVVSVLASPLVAILAFLAKSVVWLSGVKSTKKTPFVTREELELVFQASERQHGIKDLERRMIDRILSFSNRQAREIMIPLVNVVSISEDSTLAEAAIVMLRSGYSRVPVYSGRSFNIVGWINHYDLMLAKDKSLRVREIIRKVKFVPGTLLLDRLLVTIQKGGDSLAVIVDEYGGAIGIVTLEDVLEEVVGEIEDEYDAGSSFIQRVDGGRLVVNARVPIAALNELLPTKISPGSYETLGGFLTAKMQKIPEVGEEYLYQRCRFKILKVTLRSVEEVEIVLS